MLVTATAYFLSNDAGHPGDKDLQPLALPIYGMHLFLGGMGEPWIPASRRRSQVDLQPHSNPLA
jgi:hypothetical protein